MLFQMEFNLTFIFEWYSCIFYNVANTYSMRTFYLYFFNVCVLYENKVHIVILNMF
jgi:hypothetical protein